MATLAIVGDLPAEPRDNPVLVTAPADAAFAVVFGSGVATMAMRQRVSQVGVDGCRAVVELAVTLLCDTGSPAGAQVCACFAVTGDRLEIVMDRSDGAAISQQARDRLARAAASTKMTVHVDSRRRRIRLLKPV